MILNFTCDKVEASKDGTTQNVLLTKTNKTVGKKDTITPVVGSLKIDSTGLSIIITDSKQFDTYTEGQSYNLEIFVTPPVKSK